MKVILGHLAGYEDFPSDALDLLQNFPNVKADTAIEPTSKVNFAELVRKIGSSKILFGSDYPIYDSKPLLSDLRELFITIRY